MTKQIPLLKNAPVGKREIVAERRLKALQMRKAGGSYSVIGKQLGCTGRRASQLVDEALNDIIGMTESEASKLRALELERLDISLVAAMNVLQNLNAESMEKLYAVDRVIAVSNRRSKLLGLDMPTKFTETNKDGSQSLLDMSPVQMRDALITRLNARGLNEVVAIVESVNLSNGDSVLV